VSGLLHAGDPRLEPSVDPELARALVLAAPPGDATYERGRSAIVDAIGRPAPADRTTRPGHLTGSAFVVSADGRHAILLLHAKLGRWLQPGGHADGDTNLVNVAWREATEETGIAGLAIDPTPLDLDIHEVRPPREDPHLHLDVRFLVIAPPGAQPRGNAESHEIGWFGRDELAEMDFDVGLDRLATRAFARVDASRR
jgi:8-oxo-dGTP pyrophosphatase MutT (NUDIX family)